LAERFVPDTRSPRDRNRTNETTKGVLAPDRIRDGPNRMLEKSSRDRQDPRLLKSDRNWNALEKAPGPKPVPGFLKTGQIPSVREPGQILAGCVPKADRAPKDLANGLTP